MRIHFLFEWLDLALRWAHVFAGILWVGTTYYFTWVGRRLGEEVVKRLSAEGVPNAAVTIKMAAAMP